MKTTIDYEIQKPSGLSLSWKNLLNKKVYYKIKNQTSKNITLYQVEKTQLLQQDYKNIARGIYNNTEEQFNIISLKKVNLRMKKIVLEPYSKKKIYITKYSPFFWHNEDTKLLYKISELKMYEKLIFEEYDEEELKTESKFIYEEEMKNDSELIEEV